MAGVASTVVSKPAPRPTVLARLGRRNVHRDEDGANDADPNARASPLTAVWAIVQAYALVALCVTVYKSIFAAGDPAVPEDVQATHDSVSTMKQTLFGEGVIADVHNLDKFLGISTTSHHLSRLACRKTIDAIYGTGWAAEKAAYYAIDTSAPVARDLRDSAVTELQLDVAWARAAASASFAWRNLVNVAFLSWTVVRPVVVFVLPFWDFVWEGVEPYLFAAKEAVVDASEDAYFTLEETVGEELGPTLREWGRALAPLARFPGNVKRAFVDRIVRPAVYFCTYPELYGDLIVPDKPEFAGRLRWGERCRKTLWSEWGPCSARCGSGYVARQNHCGHREVRRCDGPGVVGCDEVCDSGATRDCAGRCLGNAVVDCAGECGGGRAFGCDGVCANPAAASDARGECCVSPTFVLPTTGLCNTTEDAQTEAIAEAVRLKRKLEEAKANLMAGRALSEGKRWKDRKGYSDLEKLAAEVTIADVRAGLPTKVDYLDDMDAKAAEEDAELEAAKAELAEKLRLRRELLARKDAPPKRASLLMTLLGAPFRVLAAVYAMCTTANAVLLTALGSFISVSHGAYTYAYKKFERDFERDGEDDDGASVASDEQKVRRAFDVVAESVGEWIAKVKKSYQAASEKAKASSAAAKARSEAKAEARREEAAKKKLAEKKKAPPPAAAAAAVAAAPSGRAVRAATRAALGTTVSGVLDAHGVRKRCITAMVNMTLDLRIEWRRRLRSFAGLVRVAAKGSSRPYLIVDAGGVEAATDALDAWVKSKARGEVLQPGPDSALQLLRILLNVPSAQKALALHETIRGGEAAMILLDVLAETPGVLPVQKGGLNALWAVIRLAGPRSGVSERLIKRGLFEHLEDEWEDSFEDEGVAHGIGGVIMQLALGNRAAQAQLTNVGAQALVAKILAKHHGLSYKGKFADLKTWLRERRPESRDGGDR